VATPGNRDIVGSALLNLLEVHHDRRQAELDLERAQAREKFTGRSAIPGVFAQLQEQELKRQKQRESAAKQRQAGAPTPQQLTPPPVDVTGMPTGAGSGIGRKILGEALEGIAGGGNLKRAGAAGAVANQTGQIQPGGISMQAGQMAPPSSPGIRTEPGPPGGFSRVIQERSLRAYCAVTHSRFSLGQPASASWSPYLCLPQPNRQPLLQTTWRSTNGA